MENIMEGQPIAANDSNDMRRSSDKEHEDMVTFWKNHSAEGSLAEVMLTNDAEVINAEEGPEIMACLPDLKGKCVLELGAGIGRFTSKLASEADSVVAVELMDSFVKKNKEVNGHHDNIEFRQGDVTQLSLPTASFHMVFCNWLLMYLTDDEVSTLLHSIMMWLKPGGHFFFRESCFHNSGNKHDEAINPTKYRSPSQYNQLLRSVIYKDDHYVCHVFSVILNKSVLTYIKLKNNPNQVCWLVYKMAASQETYHGYKTFQEFLDSQQYSRNSILKYEMIFGRHFVSPGGKDTAKEFSEMLDLKAGQYVLDVGCGIGGSAFYMSQAFGARVLGIDLSVNMIDIAKERALEIKDQRVEFEVADATKREFADHTFDVIYSRDTILHIKDKAQLFTTFMKWLKPGGKLLITDYCCKDGEWSQKFTDYVDQRGYYLLAPPKYGQVIESCGFTKVLAKDKTQDFIDISKSELAKLTEIKTQFLQQFSEDDYKEIEDGWESKIARCESGSQKWGLFYAEKPNV